MVEDQARFDTTMMRRAFELARRGDGYTAPNPMVGCVLSKGSTIIGEGWHHGARRYSGHDQQHGLAHAEVEAIRDAQKRNPSLVEGASAYVTLEPCDHHGSTPPCTHALINAGISRVVYAMADPNPIAAGGDQTLRKAGIKTVCLMPTLDALLLNRAWLHRMQHDTPFVTVKYACSMDGKIATANGDSKWITGEDARQRSHDLRQSCDGIIVGAGTIIADNPSLTVRHIDHGAQPLRIILDSSARTNPDSKVYSQADAPSLLVTTNAASNQRLNLFHKKNINTLTLPADENGHPNLNHLLTCLAAKGLNHIMVEGGAKILGSFLDQQLAQEIWAFIAPVIIGGAGLNPIDGTGASDMKMAPRLTHSKTEIIDTDILLRGFMPGVIKNLTTYATKKNEALCLQVS